ncbi:MAG: 3-hydroxyacyl-CoA dehydrogenase NAD-binding domain-containing protein [Archaeoglobaceae archaeon]
METVAIAGAGTMGSAISALFANAGYNVVLYDISREALERAKKRNGKEHLLELEKAGLKKLIDWITSFTLQIYQN